MNDINKMWTICQSCPYWEVCKPPYICAETEAKYKNDKEKTEKLKNDLVKGE